MTYRRPLLRADFAVILLNTFSIRWWNSNLRPLKCEYYVVVNWRWGGGGGGGGVNATKLLLNVLKPKKSSKKSLNYIFSWRPHLCTYPHSILKWVWKQGRFIHLNLSDCSGPVSPKTFRPKNDSKFVVITKNIEVVKYTSRTVFTNDFMQTELRFHNFESLIS